MCGISGLVNCGDREVLGRMTHVQAHRGPDDSGLWERDITVLTLHREKFGALELGALAPGTWRELPLDYFG